MKCAVFAGWWTTNYGEKTNLTDRRLFAELFKLFNVEYKTSHLSQKHLSFKQLLVRVQYQFPWALCPVARCITSNAKTNHESNGYGVYGLHRFCGRLSHTRSPLYVWMATNRERERERGKIMGSACFYSTSPAMDHANPFPLSFFSWEHIILKINK